MSITSVGIYGYLSGAYQDTKSKYDLTRTAVDGLTTKQEFFKTTVASLSDQSKSKQAQIANMTNIRLSQENRASQLTTSNRSTSSADKGAARMDNRLNQLNAELDDINRKISIASDSASKYKLLASQVSIRSDLSSDLGTLVYISRIFNVSMDKVVNYLIIALIIVFDPLAIAFVLVFNFLSEQQSTPKRVVPQITSEGEPSGELPSYPSDDILAQAPWLAELAQQRDLAHEFGGVHVK